MSYYDSYEFYENIKLFLDNNFYSIRILYIYDYLSKEDRTKLDKVLNLYFNKKFIFLLDKLKTYYKSEKIDIFLTKCLNNLAPRFEAKTVIIYLKVQLDDQKRIKLEDKLRKKLKNTNLKFEYRVDPSIVGGMKISYDYKVYDLTINNMLNIIKNDVIEKVNKNV